MEKNMSTLDSIKNAATTEECEDRCFGYLAVKYTLPLDSYTLAKVERASHYLASCVWACQDDLDLDIIANGLLAAFNDGYIHAYEENNAW